MHHFFIYIYQFVQRNKWTSIGVMLLFLIGCIYCTSQIKFEEDITKIIPNSANASTTANILKQLKFSDKITILIQKESKGTDAQLSQVAQQFVDTLAVCKSYIKDVQGAVNQEDIQETFDFVYENLPLFLDDSDYQLIADKIKTDSITTKVEANYRALVSPTGMVARDFILKDPLGLTFIGLKKLQQLHTGDNFILKNGFVTTKDGNMILLFINPKLSGSETEKNTLFVDQLNQIKAHFNASNSGKVSIDYFGSSFIAVANAKQIKHDIHSTLLISMLVLMVLLMWYYRKITIPLLLFIPPLFGALSGLAVLYLVKDAISAISLSIGAVLLGVTIDYSLHILTHYKENADIRVLYRDITKPLIISSTTTAIAFLCLLFVNSEALKDLGIFAAASVMVSAFVALLIVPHLYRPTTTLKETILDRIASVSFDKNKYIIGFVLILSMVSVFYYGDVSYSNNLSELNYVPEDIKATEAKLEAASDLTSKSIYTVVYGDNLDEVVNRNNNLFNDLKNKKNNSDILSYSSIGGVVLSKQQQLEKIKIWNTFWQNNSVSNVKNTLIQHGQQIGFRADSHHGFFDLLEKPFTPISLTNYAQLKALFLDEFISQKTPLYTIASVVKVNANQREPYIASIQKTDKILAIDRQQINETFLGNLKNDFTSLVNYSSIAIFLVLFFFFRRIELVAIGAIPIVLTGLVIAGVMGMTGMQLNIFSTIVCTLLFGHGVDFSIFMTSALQKEYTYGINEIKTYRSSILLAVLTTALAVGVLVFAEHPALKSISIISLLGITTAVLITFVLYPILFRICITNRPLKGKLPVNIRLLIHSTISFVYYGFGGMALSVFGQLILKVIPGKKETKMLWFRKAMSSFMKSVLYTNPFVKKTILNTYHETFEKPAVIISNHTSFLDTLAVGMLSPKIIFLVNDWVYNSPVFGKAVRLAGFYPVSQGLEGGVEHLRQKVAEGYSLMIFPEGERSWDNEIKRFHKGAFYLAEQLQLDILPVYIHGNSETLPKGDHIIYDEQITVCIDKRITIEDISFGKTYTERTKKISIYFKNEFEKLRQSIEDEAYFKRKLLMSFWYKEREIQQAVALDFQQNKTLYYQINTYLPKNEMILHWADDYGQLDILLCLQQAKRKVFTLISDPEKRAVAQNNYWIKRRKIQYVDVIPKDVNLKTLIVSCSKKREVDATLLETITTVILVDNSSLKDYFIGLDFQLTETKDRLFILKK